MGAVWNWGRRQPRTAIALVLLASQLPFLNQAFHIDDRLYLQMAEQALQTPLFPQDIATTFEGLPVEDLAGHSHLPLVSYYLAAVTAVTGSRSEWVLHLFMLVFPLLAALAMYDLGRRWTGHGPAAALLLIFSPAFMVLSHTLMTDIPLLACWLVAFSRWQALLDGEGDRLDRLWVASAVLAACFISLISAGLLLLLVAAWWLARDREAAAVQGSFLAAVVAASLALWIGWYTRAWLHYDRFVLTSTLEHMQQRNTLAPELLLTKAFSFILNAGGAFLFPVALFYGLGGPITRRLALLGGTLALVPVFAFDAEGAWRFWPAVAVAVFSAGGGLVLAEAVAAVAGRSKRRRLAGLWVGGVLAASLLLFSAGSVRYTLLALPPVLLLWTEQIQRRFQSVGVPGLLGIGVAATLLWAVPVAVSDYRFAETYRSGARDLIDDYGDRQVWFTAEWGLRYYLEANGATLLSRDGLGPASGDIVIKPRLAMPWVTRYDGAFLETIERRYPDDYLPVRILDFGSHAGFYSTAWGILPFSVGSQPWEWFNVYRVTGRPSPGP